MTAGKAFLFVGSRSGLVAPVILFAALAWSIFNRRSFHSAWGVGGQASRSLLAAVSGRTAVSTFCSGRMRGSPGGTTFRPTTLTGLYPSVGCRLVGGSRALAQRSLPAENAVEKE